MLTKDIEHQIEITAEDIVQVRETTIIKEDGVELARTHHRYVITPDEDSTTQPEKIKNVCSVVHTPEVVNTYKAKKKAEEKEIPIEEPVDLPNKDPIKKG